MGKRDRMPNPEASRSSASTVVLPRDYYYCRNRSSFHLLRGKFSKKEHIITTTIFTIYARKELREKRLVRNFYNAHRSFLPSPLGDCYRQVPLYFPSRNVHIIRVLLYHLLYQHGCIQWKPVIRTSLTDEMFLFININHYVCFSKMVLISTVLQSRIFSLFTNVLTEYCPFILYYLTSVDMNPPSLIVLDSRRILVQWTSPSISNGVIISYIVLYAVSTDPSNTLISVTVNATILELTVSGN